MKKVTLISIAILVALAAPGATHAKATTYNVLLAGGAEESRIQISLSPDGRNYVIDSIAPLEVGGSVCEHPPGNPNELVCQAALVGSFEVNAGSGNDTVFVAKGVPAQITMRGGAGNDTLTGGDGPDKLLGGAGDDRLSGGLGDDLLVGWLGDDEIFGGAGRDYIGGGPGDDLHAGGSGDDVILTGPTGKDVVRTGGGDDYVRRLTPGG